MHTSSSTSFVALYDASPEHAHFENQSLVVKARDLGRALAHHKLGIIARIGNAPISRTIAAHKEAGAISVVLSPASNRDEHERAFRLPLAFSPLIYTGRGATGADLVALASAHAMLVIGSYPQYFENILEYVKDTGMPIAVLTDEESPSLHERVRARHPHLCAHLFISHDPAVLARELADELRRLGLEKRLQK